MGPRREGMAVPGVHVPVIYIGHPHTRDMVRYRVWGIPGDGGSTGIPAGALGEPPVPVLVVYGSSIGYIQESVGWDPVGRVWLCLECMYQLYI